MTFCCSFNFAQQRIEVQIQVFILHIPLSSALCQGSVSKVVVNCDAVLFIIALTEKLEKLGNIFLLLSVHMVHVYKFIGISPVFMKVAIMLPF